MVWILVKVDRDHDYSGEDGIDDSPWGIFE